MEKKTEKYHKKWCTSRQVGQVVVDPGRTECTVRGATEPGVMPGGGSEKEKLWHGNLEGQIFALSMTLVHERIGLDAACVR